MTPEEQLRQALGLPSGLPIGGEPTTPTPTRPALPGARPVYDVRAVLGLPPSQEQLEEEDDAGIFSSFLAGAGTGLIEPLTMIPQVRDSISFMERYKGDDLRDKVAYGLGWMAGSFIPGGAAFKLGTAGARALRLARNVEKAGEVVVELTRAGKLVRGGIAGAAWAAGQEAEDVEDWMKNVTMSAAAFGIGDMAIDTGLRAAARWFKPGKGAAPLTEEMAGIARAANTTGLDEVQSVTMGRALSVIDDIVEREAGDALNMETLGSRRLKMQLGIEQLGLEEVGNGTMKIVPTIGGDIKDIQRVLDELGGYTYHTINRQTPTGSTVTDVLIAKKGEMDPRIVREFNENGWVEGMAVIWRGKKRIVTSGSKNPNILMGFAVDNPGSKLHSIRRDEMHILPFVQAPSRAMPDPYKWWAKFTQLRGDFPEEGFEKAFKEFTNQHAIYGATRERLKLFFLRQQRAAIKEIDPELASALEMVGKASAQVLRKGHPEGSLPALAAEKGFLMEWAPREAGDGFDIVLRNQSNGTGARFKTQEAAQQFVQNYMVEPGPMISGMDAPIGVGAVSVGEGGVGVVPAHSALEVSNFRSSALFTMTSRIFPRESFIRRAEDLLRRQGIMRMPYKTPKGEQKFTHLNLWSGLEGIGGFHHIREGQIKVRNELFGKYAPEGLQRRDWLGELIQMRGGKRDLKSIRPEKLDAWWSVFEKPIAKHAEEAAKAGLSDVETALLGRARKYATDLFQRITPYIEAGNDVTGDVFVEQYLPYFRRMSSARWGMALNTTLEKQGGKINKAMEMLMDDAYNQGMIGKHERDPFTVLARLTEYGLKKVHVERHYKATQEMLNRMQAGLRQMPQDTEAYRTLNLVHRSMAEYMNLTRGGAPEIHEALNVTVKNLFDQLDIKVSDVAFDRYINTLVSMNYGAFMGFRIGQPIRNLTQLMFGTMPKTGARNLAHGLESVMKNPKAAWDEAARAGVLVERSIGLAMDDVVLTKQIRQAAQGGGLASKVMKVGEKMEDFANFSLGGSVTVGGAKIPVGLFNTSDELNRVVSYFAQKTKTIKAINNWKLKGWTVDKFNDAAGLTAFGETVTAEFHRRMAASQNDAIQFLSRLLADDTQFMYQLGAGPAWMAHGVGRLFGQYGTWPAWYGELMRKGLSQGTKADKIRFLGWTAAAHTALLSAGYATGLNLSRWTGLSSFGWAGGPFFDLAKDATTIWGGLKSDGTPTAARQMTLGQYGFQDIGPAQGLAAPLNIVPGGVGQIRPKDPYKIFESTVGMFTPGMYMIRDATRTAQALQDGSVGEAMIQAMGLRRATTVGNTWPEYNFTGR